MEGRDEDERSAKRKEEISRDIPVKRKMRGKSKQEGPCSKKDTTNDTTDSGTESIEYCPDRQGTDVCSNGGYRKHEIQASCKSVNSRIPSVELLTVFLARSRHSPCL